MMGHCKRSAAFRHDVIHDEQFRNALHENNVRFVADWSERWLLDVRSPYH